MRCPSCAIEYEADTRFCSACGSTLRSACASCHEVLPVGARFCPACGRAVVGAVPRAGFGTPDTYTPRRLAEKILTSRSALEGERKQITVLFADLKSSMELIADRGEEQARQLLDEVLERMIEAVHHYEGTVNQIMGDGIMALFGAPVAHEDHAIRACYAALRMQESTQRWAEMARRELGIAVAIRIGLNSGDVVVRTINNDLHMDYSAVGMATHLAARLEQMALPGTTLLSADTHALVAGLAATRPLGPVVVRGFAESVEVYELVGAGPLPSQFHRAAARGFTRFVGRESEVEVLQRAAVETHQGHGRVVAIVGEAGVGKSRLLWEFTQSLEREGWLVLEARGLSHQRSSAYHPIVGLLRQYFNSEPSDDAATVRERVVSRLLALDAALASSAMALQAVLDVPVEDPTWNQLDPVERRQQIIGGVRRLLLRESQVRPVVVVVDDLHWIDSESLAVLDTVVDSLRGRRVLLLLGARPQHEFPWGGHSHCEKLRLEPLSTASVAQLLDALLGDAPSLGDLRRLLVTSTAGNPFFLEESVAMLAADGVLAGDRGRYKLARVPTSIRIPATVRAVLAARIDTLLPEDKRLLETAAVIGKEVEFELLRAIADVNPDDLHSGLARLQAAEFLHEARLFPELTYVFKHPLTHEVAYGGLVQHRRRTIHARVAARLEQLDAERFEERVGTLAYHAFHGGLWEKAVTWLRQAGAKAAMRSASTEAVVRFEQALEAIAHLPPTRANQERAIDLRFELRNPLFLLAEFPRALEVLSEAERLAESLGEPERLGRACAYMANTHFMLGNIEQGISLAERALSVGNKLGDSALLAFSWCHLGQLHYVKGEHGATVAAMAKCLEQLASTAAGRRRTIASLYRAVAYCFLALAQADRGRFDESLTAGKHCLEIANETGAPFYRALAAWALGHAHLERGNVDDAVEMLSRARTDCDHADIRSIRPWVTTDLGSARLLRGETDEAIAILTDAVTQASSFHLFSEQSLRLARLGEAFLQAGRMDEAMAEAGRALEHATRHGEQGFLAWVTRLQGAVGAARGDVDAARRGYEQAIALAGALEMRPLMARCHLDLAMISARIGDEANAERASRTARTMFREMKMQSWLDRAEAVGRNRL